MIGLTTELQAKIQFFFYLFAFLAFVAAAFVPAQGMRRGLGKVDLLAIGLALAIAPSVYIFFKYGFHSTPLFH